MITIFNNHSPHLQFDVFTVFTGNTCHAMQYYGHVGLSESEFQTPHLGMGY